MTLIALVIQFVLGMASNLFGTFPATSDPVELFSSGDAILLAHMAVAGILLALGLIVAALSLRDSVPRTIAAISVAGVLSIFWAFESGIEFVRSGFHENLWSFSMAIGFLAAFAVYGILGLATAPGGGRFIALRRTLGPGPDEAA